MTDIFIEQADGYEDTSVYHASWGVHVGMVALAHANLIHHDRSPLTAQGLFRQCGHLVECERILKEAGVEPAVGALNPVLANIRRAALEVFANMGTDDAKNKALANRFWDAILPPDAKDSTDVN